ncbi:MAG: hypothetical protein IPI90_15705 [Saprospiraceae bacterium]|nr:hypothetical protein [Candidatus Vicinibacter affinis]
MLLLVGTHPNIPIEVHLTCVYEIGSERIVGSIQDNTAVISGIIRSPSSKPLQSGFSSLDDPLATALSTVTPMISVLNPGEVMRSPISIFDKDTQWFFYQKIVYPYNDLVFGADGNTFVTLTLSRLLLPPCAELV